MDDLPGTQELDGIVDVRIIGQAQNVVVGQARLLFGGQILRQVGDYVAGNADGACRPGKTGRRGGIDSRGMIHKVGVKSGSPDVLVGQVSRQLVNNSPHHLQMSQFFRADVGKQTLQLSVGHRVPLAEIAQRSAQFAVRATILTDNDRCQLGVGILDLHRVLQLFLIDKHGSVPLSIPRPRVVQPLVAARRDIRLHQRSALFLIAFTPLLAQPDV